jgi:hypothetical protein
MRILIYKRTHIGDPNASREFGNEDCMGRVRSYPFDAVIGVGGVSGQPVHQQIARKINWVGRNPKRSPGGDGARGPIVTFDQQNFRLFEHNGPLLSDLAPILAKRVYGSRSRFVFTSLSSAEQREARTLIDLILDSGDFDDLQLSSSKSARRPFCRPVNTCIRRHLTARC